MPNFPSETLKLMRRILAQGFKHPDYGWALGVLDASLLLPKTGPVRSKDQAKYNEGYDFRTKEIDK